jgi:dephospho-CoA kinase
MERSGMTREEVEQRMQHQWPDAKRRAYLTDRDFIVQNDEDEAALRGQVDVLHETLLQRCGR